MFIFQYYISNFNNSLHKSQDQLHDILVGMDKDPDYLSTHKDTVHDLHDGLKDVFNQIKYALYVSSINLLFPLNKLA